MRKKIVLYSISVLVPFQVFGLKVESECIQHTDSLSRGYVQEYLNILNDEKEAIVISFVGDEAWKRLRLQYAANEVPDNLKVVACYRSAAMGELFYTSMLPDEKKDEMQRPLEYLFKRLQPGEEFSFSSFTPMAEEFEYRIAVLPAAQIGDYIRRDVYKDGKHHVEDCSEAWLYKGDKYFLNWM